MTPPANPLGLYVHWPFCARICPYCDFNVYRDRDVEANAWSDALIADLDYWATRIERRPLTSVYFGGGTPSLAPPAVIEKVLHQAEKLFGFEGDIEITLEANPDDAGEAAFERFAGAGVNRLSLGVQSFSDQALQFLGRNHDSETARAAIRMAQRIFPRSTFDLIYARPEQSVDDWRGELSEALAFGPRHISLYQLTIEPGTAFAKAVDAGRWRPPDDGLQAAQYEIAQDMTAEAGLSAYEVSNYAAPGAESRHNLIYWRYQDYIGVGPGAHGRLVIDGEKYATKTIDRPGDYLAAANADGGQIETCELLDDEAQLVERLSMGLRLAEGAPLYADDVFYGDEARVRKLGDLVDDGFLSMNCGTLRATSKGRPLLNRLIYTLLG